MIMLNGKIDIPKLMILKKFLTSLMQDITIDVYDDEWFGILQFWFDDIEQDGYTDDKFFICDTIDGVKEFLDKF